MRPLRSVVFFFAFVFIGGALLAPWIYELAQAGASSSPWLRGLAHNPFHRFVSRSFLILALIGFWPFLRSLGMRSWSEVGFCSPKTEWRKLAMGLALGFGSLALVALITILARVREPYLHYSSARAFQYVVNAGLAAVVVAIFEELLFRGTLFGALRKAHGWVVALVLSSGFYALVHFFQTPANPKTITWLSGLITLGQMLHGLAEFDRLIPEFLTLFVAGVLLAWAYQRTGSLYFSIGLHAGWIFWVKSYGFLTRHVAGTDSWFWGTGRLIDGWLACIVLVCVLMIFPRLPLEGRTPKAASAK